jgi:hypothetical protein
MTGQRDQLFSGHKYMTDMEKALIRTLNNKNIPTRKDDICCVISKRGTYNTTNVSNYRTKINREVTDLDMTHLLNYFRTKKAGDPSFFYKFNLQDNKKVENLFLTDGCLLCVLIARIGKVEGAPHIHKCHGLRLKWHYQMFCTFKL